MNTINEIPNKKFTLTPVPLKDEYISSYLFRLGLSNDIDINEAIDITNLAKIMSGQLDKLVILANKPTEVLENTNLSDLWLYYTKYKDGIIKFCPYCLRESEYYRKQWKLKYYCICETHKTLMLDTCPECSSKIYDYSQGKINSVGVCVKCKSRLKDYSAPVFEDSKAFDMQKTMHDISFNKVHKFESLKDYSYNDFTKAFYVISDIFRELPYTSDNVCWESPFQIKPDDLKMYFPIMGPLLRFEFVNTKYEFILFNSILRIFQNWPFNLHKLFNEYIYISNERYSSISDSEILKHEFYYIYNHSSYYRRIKNQRNKILLKEKARQEINANQKKGEDSMQRKNILTDLSHKIKCLFENIIQRITVKTLK